MGRTTFSVKMSCPLSPRIFRMERPLETDTRCCAGSAAPRLGLAALGRRDPYSRRAARPSSVQRRGSYPRPEGVELLLGYFFAARDLRREARRPATSGARRRPAAMTAALALATPLRGAGGAGSRRARAPA